VYDGIGHLLLTPQDLLPLVAMALLAGLAGPRGARPVLLVLPLAWTLGGLVGLSSAGEIAWPWLGPAWALMLGGLVAAGRRMPRPLLVTVATVFAVGHGFLNGTAMQAAGLGARAVLGIGATAFVLVALGAALAVVLRDGWTRVVVRVAGSWICAAGLLMVGWLAR
jgi:hydrogenase/urease accessory protein HupE